MNAYCPQVSDAGNREIIEVTSIDGRKAEEHTIEMIPNAIYGINM
jgi:hypothetical protein